MWQYQNTDELYHYGVLGMKWGHRKNYIQSILTARKKYKSENKKALNSFNNRLNSLEKNGKGNNNKLVINEAKKYDSDRIKIKNQYKTDKQNAKNSYKTKINAMKSTKEYSVHKQKVKTVGKAVVKTALQNAALYGAGVASVMYLSKKGETGAAMAIANLNKAARIGNVARNAYTTNKQLKKIK